MNEYSNIIREQTYFRPSNVHLDVFVSFQAIKLLNPVSDDQWQYKMKIFCSVPVISFNCKSMGCSILIHLNYQYFKNLNLLSWLKEEHITFMLLISDASLDNHIVGAKTLRLSRKDSDRVRSACLKQAKLSYQSIEDAVDFLYELDIENIWPK